LEPYILPEYKIDTKIKTTKMKKTYFQLIAITLLLISCGNSTDSKKITIDNFNEKFVDSLIPIPNKSYFVYYIKIEGTSNDTIRISPSKADDPKDYYYYLTGDFKKEIRSDYYGGAPEYITFDPYKATKGKFKITYRF
jgi:hypothetical protein